MDKVNIFEIEFHDQILSSFNYDLSNQVLSFEILIYNSEKNNYKVLIINFIGVLNISFDKLSLTKEHSYLGILDMDFEKEKDRTICKSVFELGFAQPCCVVNFEFQEHEAYYDGFRD